MNQRPAALVTGAARRVGRQIALSLAQAGYDVAITYQGSKSEAEEVASSIGRISHQAAAIQADLTRADVADSVYREVFSAFGRLDVLVNNASLFQPGDDAETIHRMMALHFESPLRLCRAFEKQLRAARGHVVNMLDLLAEKPMPKYAAYCASKAALWNLTLTLARELAPEVTVNGIAPGVIEWPNDYSEEQKQQYLRRVPLARAGTPKEAADAVLFFTRDGYVTGQILRLDGGRSLA